MSEIDWTKKKSKWISQVDDLINDIKSWSETENWLVDKREKTLNEEHLGSYSVPELTIKTPQGNIIVEPVGRNIVGAEGRVDVYTFPSFNRMLLVAYKDRWVVKTDSKISWPNVWGKDTFFEIVKALTEDL